MPADLPAHNDPIAFNRGNWVPVGWKPLVPSEKVRKSVFAHIAKRKAEAQDLELQRNAKQKRKQEKIEQKLRAAEELKKCEAEIERLKTKKLEIEAEKKQVFASLKEVCAEESKKKKQEEEKKRLEASLQSILNPAAAVRSYGAPVQSSSLISQQNLINQQQQLYYPPNSAYNAMLQAQLLQQLATRQQQQQQQHQQQQQAATTNKQQSTLHPLLSSTSVAHSQASQRNQLIPSAAHSPFYSANSNYSSPAPSRNFIPPQQQQQVNSPRRERAMPPSAMASPSTKYIQGQHGAQSRHNSIGTSSIAMSSAMDQIKAELKSEEPDGSYSASPSNFMRGLANYQNPAEADAASVALHRGYMLQQQHQPSPNRR